MSKRGRSRVQHTEPLRAVLPLGEQKKVTDPCVDMRVPNHGSKRGSLLLVFWPTPVAIVVALILMLWPVTTRIDLKLNVRAIRFDIDPTQALSRQITNSVAFRTLSVRQFQKATFPLGTFSGLTSTEAKPKPGDVPRDSVMRIVSGDERLQPALTLACANNRQKMSGSLDAITASPGSSVELAVVDEHRDQLILKMSGENLSSSIGLENPFVLRLEQCHTTVRGSHSDRPYQVYRASPQGANPCATVTGSRDPLTFYVRLPYGAESQTFTSAPIPVSRISCLMESPSTGEIISSLDEDGIVRYNDYPFMEERRVPRAELLDLCGLVSTDIERISASQDKPGLQFEIRGVLPDSKELRREYGLTLYDVISANNMIAVLFGVAVFVTTQTLALVKHFQRGEQ